MVGGHGHGGVWGRKWHRRVFQKGCYGVYGWHKWCIQIERVKRKIVQYTKTWFIEHQHWLTCVAFLLFNLLSVALVICVFFFLLYWTHDLPILVYDIIETLTLYCCYCLLEYNNYSPTRNTCCSSYLNSYNSIFKENDPMKTINPLALDLK